MDANSKALLVQGKALADPYFEPYSKAMLSTSERMADKLKAALASRGMSQVAFAEKCGVSKQAVQSWVKTGRVDKKHLPKFVEVLGYPLEWWLDPDATTNDSHRSPPPPAHHVKEQEPTPYSLSSWPFISISPSEYACLTERQMGSVEGYVRALLNESAPAKRNGTTGH